VCASLPSRTEVSSLKIAGHHDVRSRSRAPERPCESDCSKDGDRHLSITSPSSQTVPSGADSPGNNRILGDGLSPCRYVPVINPANRHLRWKGRWRTSTRTGPEQLLPRQPLAATLFMSSRGLFSPINGLGHVSCSASAQSSIATLLAPHVERPPRVVRCLEKEGTNATRGTL
jgi:hypothetical protein